ncbi:hypothetical protein [Olsenella uli]|uniref:hypothetical protein n=1 Tax=Olsenella uli TaxID=133926 RepID=UPI0011D11B1E|nr:hypothetical protein [Olsenella uli]
METMEQLLKKAIESHTDSSIAEIREKDTAFCKIELHCDRPFKAVRDSAIDAGTVIEEDEDKGIVSVLIKGGAVPTPPALIVARVQANQVELASYFHEGLIPQHAAKKTLEIFAKAMTSY